MRKEIYGFLTKYDIYNPEFKPPDCAFEYSSLDLQKNEKFQFLRSKLKEYYQGPKIVNKVTLLIHSSEQWKSCFYKNLHSLLTEVAFTFNTKIQEEMLNRIQEWFFSKLRLPNIATPLSELACSPLTKTPSPVNSSQNLQGTYLPKHEKSQSLNVSSKFQINKLYKENQKFETLKLGAAENRTKILSRIRYNMTPSKKLSQSPSNDYGLEDNNIRLPKIKLEEIKTGHYGQEIEENEKIRTIRTPLKYNGRRIYENLISDVKNYPNGGEKLMKVRPIPSIQLMSNKF